VKPAIKRRVARAKDRAANVLKQTGYSIVPSDNSVFCILGVRNKEIRMIRVTIDEVTDFDISTVKGFDKMPANCSMEIWCKKINRPHFEIMEIRE